MQLVLARFANGEMSTLWVGVMLALITVTAYVTMNNVALSLEDPFVHPPNDLPAQAMLSK